MGAMTLQHLFALRPQQSLQIDENNPITAGLQVAFDHGICAAGIVGQTPTVVGLGNSVRTVGPMGAAVRAANTSSGCYDTPWTGNLTGKDYTLFAVGFTTDVSNNLSAIDDDTGSVRRFQFRLAAGKVDFIPFSGGASPTGEITGPAMTAAQAARGFTMGATHAFVSNSPLTGIATAWQNGVKLGAASTSDPQAMTGSVRIGSRKNNSQGWSSGGLSLVAIWNRALADAEMQSLAANPWQIFVNGVSPVYGAAVAALVAAPKATPAVLSGGAAAVASAFGALTTAVAMSSTARAQGSATGSLSTAIALNGGAAASASASGTLTTGNGLAGTALAAAVATAALSTAIRLAGAAVSAAAGVGRLTTGIRLAGAAVAQASASSALAGGVKPIDASKIPAARVVAFEGSGSRLVVFEGSGSRLRFEQMNVSAKEPIKVGGKWMADRDPDEKSHYAADITQELLDRATTATSVELVLVGVVQLEDPSLQVVTIDGVQRTYVVAFLGGTDTDPPEGWKWVARVSCANQERFDKSTWFNKVDT